MSPDGLGVCQHPAERKAAPRREHTGRRLSPSGCGECGCAQGEGEKVRFGFHNLRHSLASFLVRKGTDVKTVQKMLRHSDVATTLGIYAHSMSEDRLAAQDDMLAAMMTPVKRSELSDHTRKTQVSDIARLLPYSPSLVQNFGLSLQVR